MNPRWENYAVPLGLTIEQTKYYLEQQQEALRGLQALKHWRDGRCGSSYPGTWKFLLEVIKDCLGPNVAETLRAKITANKLWTLKCQIGRCSFPFVLLHVSVVMSACNDDVMGRWRCEQSSTQTSFTCQCIYDMTDVWCCRQCTYFMWAGVCLFVYVHVKMWDRQANTTLLP